MATIKTRKRKNGESYQIYFYLGGERKTLSLDRKYSRTHAEEIALNVQKVVNALESGGTLNRSTQTWLDDMTDDLRERFVNAGLIEETQEHTLANLWDRFFEVYPKRNHLKDQTVRTYITVQRRFFRFFRPQDNSNTLTVEDCKEWMEEIEDEYAKATLTGCVQRCRTVFGWALREGYIDENPFTKIPRGSFENKDNERTISMDWYRKLLDACPDQTWRTLLALCRIGGLRNPSETLRVKWSEVNWSEGTMLVHAPKTEHHTGKDTRIIPLFPDLRVELERQFEQAEEGSVYVIDRWRETSKNMRTYFKRIIFLAGLEEWPRLFHNLRGSRSNELFSEYAVHVATAWMGQSERVALKYYLHPSATDFQKALAENKNPKQGELSEKTWWSENS